MRAWTRLAAWATRALLLRLVKIGSGVEDTRRRLPYTDLAGHGDSAVPAAIIESFTQARLLTRERDSVEITHEVLLRAWPRLRHWIEDDRADNLIRQELEEAAADWEHAGRDAGMLYREAGFRPREAGPPRHAMRNNRVPPGSRSSPPPSGSSSTPTDSAAP